MDGEDILHVFKNIERIGAETELATPPMDAWLSRYASERTLAWSEEDSITNIQSHLMHSIGVDKPGVMRSLASLPAYDHATIEWTDEASGLILMKGIRKGSQNTPLIVVWI